jgi:hypothetical protein
MQTFWLFVINIVVVVATIYAPTGLALVLTIANVFIPDLLPFIDEGIQIGICMRKLRII